MKKTADHTIVIDVTKFPYGTVYSLRHQAHCGFTDRLVANTTFESPSAAIEAARAYITYKQAEFYPHMRIAITPRMLNEIKAS